MAVNQSGDKFVTLEKLPDRSHLQRRRGGGTNNEKITLYNHIRSNPEALWLVLGRSG